jgi:Tfp pilus assembly protein PilF
MVGIALLVACATDVGQKREQANSHIDVGTAYIGSGDYNGALKELLKAQTYAPEDPRVHYFLALAYMGKGYRDKAIESCRTAVTLKDDYSEAHNLLGTIYMDGGKYDLAIASFNKALSNILYDTPAFALYHLGRIYYQMGDYSRAMVKYQ